MQSNPPKLLTHFIVFGQASVVSLHSSTSRQYPESSLSTNPLLHFIHFSPPLAVHPSQLTSHSLQEYDPTLFSQYSLCLHGFSFVLHSSTSSHCFVSSLNCHDNLLHESQSAFVGPVHLALHD